MTISGDKSYFCGNLTSHKHWQEIWLSGLGLYFQFCGRGSGLRNTIFLTLVLFIRKQRPWWWSLRPQTDSERERRRLGLWGSVLQAQIRDGVLVHSRSGYPPAGRGPRSKWGDEVGRGASSLTHGGLSVPVATLLQPAQAPWSFRGLGGPSEAARAVLSQVHVREPPQVLANQRALVGVL